MDMSTGVYRSLSTIVDRDVTSPPEGDFNTRGALYLKDAASTTMEHLLGTNFDIMDGSRDVIVPDDIPAGSYQVVCEFSWSTF